MGFLTHSILNLMSSYSNELMAWIWCWVNIGIHHIYVVQEFGNLRTRTCLGCCFLAQSQRLLCYYILILIVLISISARNGRPQGKCIERKKMMCRAEVNGLSLSNSPHSKDGTCRSHCAFSVGNVQCRKGNLQSGNLTEDSPTPLTSITPPPSRPFVLLRHHMPTVCECGHQFMGSVML